MLQGSGASAAKPHIPHFLEQPCGLGGPPICQGIKLGPKSRKDSPKVTEEIYRKAALEALSPDAQTSHKQLAFLMTSNLSILLQAGKEKAPHPLGMLWQTGPELCTQVVRLKQLSGLGCSGQQAVVVGANGTQAMHRLLCCEGGGGELSPDTIHSGIHSHSAGSQCHLAAEMPALRGLRAPGGHLNQGLPGWSNSSREPAVPL